MDDSSEQAKPEDQQGDDERVLLRFLATRDKPCPACGYNLRLLRKPVCPECGLALKLTVGSDIAFKREWAVTLCLNAMVAGAGVFFLLLTFAGGSGPDLDELLTYLWYFGPIAWIPMPLIIFWARRWFCRMSSGLQYAMVVLSSIWIVFLGVSLVSTI